jgi:thiol-disulfide isomerase/thioredoxin
LPTRRVDQPWSGSERNQFFRNLGAGEFRAHTRLSGLDSKADGRVAVRADFDGDGWEDLALMNSSAPSFQFFRNRVGALHPEDRPPPSVGFLLEGGARPGRADGSWAPRDGIGARVIVTLGERRLVRELAAGNGFSARDSRVLLVGLGGAREADRVEVRWPSGRTQVATGVPAGSLWTVYEDPEQSPSGAAFVRRERPARQEEPEVFPEVETEPLPGEIAGYLPEAPAAGHQRLRVLTTMATWCASCRRELPRLTGLREALAGESVGFYGLPVSSEDTPEKLDAYLAEHSVPYQLLETVPEDRRTALAEAIAAVVGLEGLPATLVVDAEDRVRWRGLGLPSLSDLRTLLRPSSP